MNREIINRDQTITMVVERSRKRLVGEIIELPGCFTGAPDLPALEFAGCHLNQDNVKG